MPGSGRMLLHRTHGQRFISADRYHRLPDALNQSIAQPLKALHPGSVYEYLSKEKQERKQNLV
jgi:hypothetical protein